MPLKYTFHYTQEHEYISILLLHLHNLDGGRGRGKQNINELLQIGAAFHGH